MNKKLVYIFAVLVVGLFVISACEQAVGRKISKAEDDNVKIQRMADVEVQQAVVNIGDIDRDIEQIELLRPVVPNPNNPEIQWVTGLQCGGSINEELIEENDGDRNFALTEDLECEGSGILIEADDVNLVCNGHRITGPGVNNNLIYGIYAEGVSGISILGCEISGFNGGIAFNHVEESELIDNTANENYNYGIILRESSSNTLTENTANENRYFGIYLSYYGSSNTLTENTANENLYGIFLQERSSNNILTENTANKNGEEGIYLSYSSSSNTLTENTANENEGKGILVSGESNTLIGNTANENRYGGIYFHVEGSDNIITRQELVCSTS